MKELTLYDLMGSDHYIIAGLENDGEVRTIVIDESDQVVFQEKSHRFAWESLVGFAKMVLEQNKKIEKDMSCAE